MSTLPVRYDGRYAERQAVELMDQERAREARRRRPAELTWFLVRRVFDALWFVLFVAITLFAALVVPVSAICAIVSLFSFRLIAFVVFALIFWASCNIASQGWDDMMGILRHWRRY